MTRDVLLEATQALRDSVDTDDAESRATRARVLSTLRARRSVRRVRALRWLPLTACLGTLSAWAASRPVPPTLWNDAAKALGIRKPVREVSRPSTAKAVHAARPEATPEPRPDTPMTSTAVVETHATSPTGAERSRATEPAAANLAQPPPTAAAPPRVVPHRGPTQALDIDREHELYRAAHRAHFVTQDPEAALPAWDAYLAAAPSGRFAVEARYNRALCLLRLGRTDAARVALTPFAEGTFGEYRRREAEELLRALTDR